MKAEARGLLGGLLISTFLASAAGAQRPQVTTFVQDDDGLPSSRIVDLEQHPSGRLWILSRGGVTRFDGHAFMPAPRAGLTDRELQGLEIDAGGRVWTVTRWLGPFVFYLDGPRWRPLPDPPGVSSLEVTSFLAWSRQARTSVAVGSSMGLWLWDGGAWSRWRAADGLPSDGVRALAEVGGGTLAVGTLGGLCFLRPEGLDCGAGRDPRLAQPILALTKVAGPGGHERLWMLFESWLGHLEGGRLTVVADGIPPSGDGVLRPGSIAIDAAGGVYFGNRGLAYFFDSRTGKAATLGIPEGLVSEGATALVRDRESNVWVGSPRGLSRIGGRRFLSFGDEQGLLEDEVSAVAELPDGRLVLGHNAGLTFFEDGHGRRRVSFGTPPGALNSWRVLDMAVGADGAVWVAANLLGLLRLSPDGSWRPAIADHSVFSVDVDAAGRVWAASYDAVFAGGASGWEELHDDDLNYVRWVTAGADGRVYCSTTQGLWWREGGEWFRALGPTSESNGVFGLRVEPGRVWVGTAGGLYRLADGELVRADLGGRTVDDPVYFILADGEGRTWLGTHDGVLLWDGAELRRLTRRHGLAGRETNRGAALVDRSGRVWVGTDAGLSMYQPHYDRRSAAPPNVELQALEVNGEMRPFGAAVDLGHRENNLTFRVATIALSGEDEVAIRYRLEPFDVAWQEREPSRSEEIRYTNLPSGRYRFRIAARWSEADWGAELDSPSIVIDRPYWRQPWFPALALVGAGLLALGFHALRTRAIRARNAELEAVNAELERSIAERQKLIAELETRNAELERFTYTVSHDLKSPLVTIKGFLGHLRRDLAGDDVERSRHDLAFIEGAADRMGLLLDELLELSRVGRVAGPREEVPMTGLADEAVSLLGALIARRGVAVEVAPGMPAVVGDRLRLLEVMQNLIENAVKYMGDQGEPRVEVGVRRQDGGAVFFVADNGLGIDARYHDKVFGLFERLDPAEEGTGVGLALVKRIVELHGGRIWVESAGEGRGSNFCFTLPPSG